MSIMKKITACLFLIAISFLVSIDQTYSVGEESIMETDIDQSLRAVWMTPLVGELPGNVTESVWKNQFLNETFPILEYYKFNTIIIHFRSHNNALYKSTLSPKASWFANVNFNTFDPMEWLIEEAHNRGIEVHAWLNPYRVASGSTDLMQYKSGTIPSANPQNNTANLLSYNGATILNPGLPAVRSFFADVVEEIITQYDVDGIHFDDYFYINLGANGATSGDTTILSEPDQATFVTYGAGYNTTSATSKADWRRHQVNLMVEMIHDRIKTYNTTHNKHIQFGIAPTGIYKNGNGVVTYDANGNAITTGSATNGQAHYSSYLFADSLKWINEGWIDYMMPQSYWAIGHPIAGYYNVMGWWDKVVKYKDVSLYSGIGVYMADSVNNTYTWQTDMYDLNKQFNFLETLENTQGISVYSYQYLRLGYNQRNNPTAKSAQQIANAAHHWNEYSILPELKSEDPVQVDGISYISHNAGTLTFNTVDNAKFYYIYRSTGSLTYSNSEIIGVVRDKDQPMLTFATGDNSNNYNYGVRALSVTNHLGPTVADIISVVEGASIRNQSAETSQGLRFYAELAEGQTVDSKGFYLVYGATTFANLQNAINNPVSGKIIVNGKQVFKVNVGGLDENNRYSVVLTGIPEIGYATKITAYAYYVKNGVEVLSNSSSTRSIGQVAINMEKSGNGSSTTSAIIASLAANFNVTQVTVDGISVSGSIFEVDRLKLKTEFIKDWNTKFGNTLNSSASITNFHNQMKVGLTDSNSANYNLSTSNIYKFFNDSTYRSKWIWLLDYLISIDSTTHTTRQANAIKGNGTFESLQTWNAIHISSSIYNFFNRSHEVNGFTAINFLESNEASVGFYQEVAQFSNSILIEIDNYTLTPKN